MPLFTSVLFGAGIGNRLRPLTTVMPKPGLPMLDVALAAWGLADLRRLGGPVIMNLSAGHDAVSTALGDLLDGIELFIETPEPLGSGGTIVALRDGFAGPVVTRNSDLLSSVSAADVARTHIAGGALATIAIQAVEEGADLIEQDGALELVDRRIVDVGGARFLGVAVFEPAALALADPRGPRDLASGLLARLIARGEVATHHHDGYALDVGTPARFFGASLDLLYDRAPRPPVPFPGAIVEVDGGRAYLGPGAMATPDSLGPGAIVLARARVEPGARVSNAIVWPDEVVSAGTDVTDCIRAFGTRIALEE